MDGDTKAPTSLRDRSGKTKGFLPGAFDRFPDSGRSSRLRIAVPETTAVPRGSERTIIRRADREVLEHWLRCPTTPQRVVKRSRIVLSLMSGATIRHTAAELGASRATVKRWWCRYVGGGPAALTTDAPGRGRKCAISAAQEKELAALARNGRLHGQRTVMVLARRWGVSRPTIYRALQRINGPHAPRARQF